MPRMSDLIEIFDGPLEVWGDSFERTEGPLWHPHGYWLFVDLDTEIVYKMAPGGDPQVIRPESGHANGMTFDLQGRVLMCEATERRISRMESDGSITTLVDRLDGKRINRPNDIICTSDGTIYFTDPQSRLDEAYREIGSSMIIRVAPDGLVDGIVPDILSPNGLALSPDERTFYLINSREPKLIRAYDRNASGWFDNPRDFADLSDQPGAGITDGMKVDVDGRIYSTGPGGLWVFEPDGRIVGTLPLPETATNCAFGGDDYGTMLITAHKSVFAIRLHTRGVVPPGARALMR